MPSAETIGMLLKNKAGNRVLSVTPEQSVYDALELLAKYDIGALPVISDNHLVGILSERDYARKVILLGHSSHETKVHQIMTSPVYFISPEKTVEECMAIMTQQHFRHLPVLEGETITGIVSIGDLVKWVIRDREKTIQDLESYISSAYPG